MAGRELREFGLWDLQVGDEFTRIGNTERDVIGADVLSELDIAGRNDAGYRCTNARVVIIEFSQRIGRCESVKVVLEASNHRCTDETTIVQIEVALILATPLIQISLRGQHLQTQSCTIEPGKNLTFLDLIAFFHQQFDDVAGNARKYGRVGVRCDRCGGFVSGVNIGTHRMRHLYRHPSCRLDDCGVGDACFTDAAAREGGARREYQSCDH